MCVCVKCDSEKFQSQLITSTKTIERHIIGTGSFFSLSIQVVLLCVTWIPI